MQKALICQQKFVQPFLRQKKIVNYFANFSPRICATFCGAKKQCTTMYANFCANKKNLRKYLRKQKRKNDGSYMLFLLYVTLVNSYECVNIYILP